MKKLFKISIIVTLLNSLVILLPSCKKQSTLPVIATSDVTAITDASAMSGGIVTSDGGAGVTVRGVCWALNANPTISDPNTNDGQGEGQFISSITGLNGGSTYHVRAYATNSVGTSYGSDMIFSTLGQAPSAATLAATNISTTYATLNGVVNSNYLSTTVSFEYGTTSSYGQTIIATPSSVEGNSNINVIAELSGLTAGTTYHFRVKTENSLGITYGSELTFNTAPDHDLNDYWMASDGYGVKIDGTHGIFYSFSSIWQEVANAGLVSIGSESFRSITRIDELNWTYDNLWWLRSNNIYSIVWSPESTIKMSSDGQSFMVTSTNPTDFTDTRTKTYTRDTHKSARNSFKDKALTNSISGY